jgi:hypothetical protein
MNGEERHNRNGLPDVETNVVPKPDQHSYSCIHVPRQERHRAAYDMYDVFTADRTLLFTPFFSCEDP